MEKISDIVKKNKNLAKSTLKSYGINKKQKFKEFF